MDKNTITGFVLIAALLIGFSWYNKPSDEEIAQQQRVQDSIANVEKKKAAAKQAADAAAAKANAQALATDTTSLFHEVMSGKSTDVTLRNEKVELTLNTKGATVQKAVIKGFADRNGNNDVTLFDAKDQQLKFMLAGKETNLVTSDMYFTPSNVTDSTVTFTAATANGKSLTISYKLGKDYMLHASIQANGMAGKIGRAHV